MGSSNCLLHERSTHTCSAEQKIEEASKAIAAAVILELEPLADAPLNCAGILYIETCGKICPLDLPCFYD